jgi:hypothetical protein
MKRRNPTTIPMVIVICREYSHKWYLSDKPQTLGHNRITCLIIKNALSCHWKMSHRIGFRIFIVSMYNHRDKFVHLSLAQLILQQLSGLFKCVSGT